MIHFAVEVHSILPILQHVTEVAVGQIFTFSMSVTSELVYRSSLFGSFLDGEIWSDLYHRDLNSRFILLQLNYHRHSDQMSLHSSTRLHVSVQLTAEKCEADVWQMVKYLAGLMWTILEILNTRKAQTDWNKSNMRLWHMI